MTIVEMVSLVMTRNTKDHREEIPEHTYARTRRHAGSGAFTHARKHTASWLSTKVPNLSLPLRLALVRTSLGASPFRDFSADKRGSYGLP